MALQVNPLALAKLDTPPAVAFPISIRETSGDGRLIVLKGRSLPYRGVDFPSGLRVNVKYFPGNPVGQAQVLGPEWLPTTMRGMWKDAFLDRDESAPDILNFPVVGAPGRPGSSFTGGKSFQSGGSVPGNVGKARRARVVRDAFYMLQRGGQLLRVQWGSIVRFGFIGSFSADHDREEDIRWEVEFKWIGDTDAPPRIQLIPEFDAPGLLAALIAAAQAFLDAINRALAIAFGLVNLVNQRLTRLGTLIADFVSAISGIVQLVFAPAELFGTLKQQITRIKLAARDLVNTARAIPQAYAAGKGGADPNGINLAQAAGAAIIYNLQRLGALAQQAIDDVEAVSIPEILGVYSVTEGTTLRDVATRFYGSPNSWGAIADYNGLASSTPPVGTQLAIPILEGS